MYVYIWKYQVSARQNKIWIFVTQIWVSISGLNTIALTNLFKCPWTKTWTPIRSRTSLDWPQNSLRFYKVQHVLSYSRVSNKAFFPCVPPTRSHPQTQSAEVYYWTLGSTPAERTKDIHGWKGFWNTLWILKQRAHSEASAVERRATLREKSLFIGLGSHKGGKENNQKLFKMIHTQNLC